MSAEEEENTTRVKSDEEIEYLNKDYVTKLKMNRKYLYIERKYPRTQFISKNLIQIHSLSGIEYDRIKLTNTVLYFIKTKLNDEDTTFYFRDKEICDVFSDEIIKNYLDDFMNDS